MQVEYHLVLVMIQGAIAAFLADWMYENIIHINYDVRALLVIFFVSFLVYAVYVLTKVIE